MAIKNKFNIANSEPAVLKNRIIGGDFATNPWQRGTSKSQNAVIHSYLADRWKVGNNSTSAVLTQSKDSDAPTFAQCGVNGSASLNVNVNTAQASFTGSDHCNIYQWIEDYNMKDLGFGLSGTRYVTVSFWCKSNAPGTYCASLRNGANTRSYVVEFTVNASATWEKKTIVFPVDTAGTYTYTGSFGLLFLIMMSCGSSFATTPNTWVNGALHTTSNQSNLFSTANNYFKLALVQLEAGNQATAFEQRSAVTELDLCLRYYEKNYPQGIYPGASNVANVHVVPVITNAIPTGYDWATVYYKKTKRGNPTVTTYSQAGTAFKCTYSGGSESAANACYVDAGASNTNSFVANNGSGASITATPALYFNWAADADF